MPNVTAEELCRDVMVPVCMSISTCSSKPSMHNINSNNSSKPDSKGKILNISHAIAEPVRVDSGVNTLISQSLHFHKPCVKTLGVSKRKCCCRFKRQNFQKCDKACTYFIETSNCGTQLPDQSRSCLTGKPIPEYAYDFVIKHIQQPYERIKDAIERLNVFIAENRPKKPEEQPSTFINLERKRWAISRHPIQGPDF